MTSIITQAKLELAEEGHRQAVNEMKLKLRSAKWWHKILHFKITITKKTKLHRPRAN